MDVQALRRHTFKKNTCKREKSEEKEKAKQPESTEKNLNQAHLQKQLFKHCD